MLTVRRVRRSRSSTRPGHTPGSLHLSDRRRSCCSRATSCSPARSDGRDFPNSSPADMERSASSGSSSLPDDLPDCCPGHGLGPRVGRERETEPLPPRTLEWSSSRRAGPHDLLPPAPTRCCGLYEAAAPDGAAVRVPLRGDADLRAHRAVRAHVGETSDVVTKEMYTFEDKGGRSVTLRPEQHGRRRPRVPRARARPADAVQGVLRGASVPARHGRRRAAPRVPAVRGRDRSASARPDGRRRGRRAGRAVPPRTWASRGSTLHLNSIGDARVPAGLPREADRVPRAAPAIELDEDCRTRLADESAPRLRLQGRRPEADFVLGAPTISGPPVPVRAAEHFAAVRYGPRRGGRRVTSTTRGSSAGSTTTRGRRSSGRRERALRRRRPRRAAAAGATTASPRCSADRRRPASGSRSGWIGSAWPCARTGRVPRAPARASRASSSPIGRGRARGRAPARRRAPGRRRPRGGARSRSGP